MDRSHYRSGNTTHFDCKGTEKIVDYPKSSNPHSLLQIFAPINNANYNPTLPTAS